MLNRAFSTLVACAVAIGIGLPASGETMDCLIEPWADVTVSAAIEGLVDEVLVQRGDIVTKGQVVARLEASVESATVDAARIRAEGEGRVEASAARLRFAARELERRSQLGRENVLSQSAMDEAESSEKVARADHRVAQEDRRIAQHEVKRASAALARRTIRSPIAGVVVERILEPGEYADPPQVVRIAQIDPLRVEVFAPLSAYGTIKVGDAARVRPEAPIGGVHAATVVVVDPVVDSASATFGVRLELLNPEHAIPAGLNCKVEFGQP